MNLMVDGNPDLCTPTGNVNLSLCTPSLAPALVFDPGEDFPLDHAQKSMSHTGAIAGGVTGAVVLVGMVVVLVCLCLLRAKRSPGGTSDTGSSEPSAQIDWARGSKAEIIPGDVTAATEVQRARRFSIQELEHATKNFSESNLIGEGSFGPVYKGLLDNGTIVAIKRRRSNGSNDLVPEVELLVRIRHRHLVNVLGYCQENEQQMLVYDYLPNGSVCDHLYDGNGNPSGELDFKLRLTIALGAAKGLEHLHTQMPIFIHKGFKTANVLLDESLVAKVTDFGLSTLLCGVKGAMSSSNGDAAAGFLDPEYYSLRRFTEKSDVYSFGVFLFELISGREAISHNRPRPEWSVTEWACELLVAGNLEALVDGTLASSFKDEALRKLLRLGFHCIEASSSKRPTMSEVALELEAILEKERGMATTAGEGMAVVTLGSELFT
ncbi:hypothetical protein O6H91_Y177300 [Diphasiastrum complanatum]|nr:hypothetical protein O6H91_Y177300 [Diphasiastrum complanatum]